MSNGQVPVSQIARPRGVSSRCGRRIAGWRSNQRDSPGWTAPSTSHQECRTGGAAVSRRISSNFTASRVHGGAAGPGSSTSQLQAIEEPGDTLQDRELAHAGFLGCAPSQDLQRTSSSPYALCAGVVHGCAGTGLVREIGEAEDLPSPRLGRRGVRAGIWISLVGHARCAADVSLSLRCRIGGETACS
jgi:hypothetical protein